MNRSHFPALMAAIVLLLPNCITAQSAAPSAPPTATPATPDKGSKGVSLDNAGTPVVDPQMAAKLNGPNTIQVNVRLVVLDVVVKDKKGNLVTDLTKDDFHVTESGEEQTLLRFDTSARHMAKPEVTINSTADLDKYAPDAPVNIILLDEFNTRFEDMAFARYSLKQYLKAQPDKLNTPTMLLAASLSDFTVVNDYTQDKQALIQSLDKHFAGDPWQAEKNDWKPERMATAFMTLERVAEATLGHPGHKNMIWIGRGFPAFRFENISVDGQQNVNNAVQRCVNMLRDARVTLYSVDPAGLQVYQTYGNDAAFNDPFGGNYQFAKMAVATGGKALYGRNDVDAEIGTSASDGEHFYTLTYRPTTGSNDPQKFRKIVVTVDRPDLKATTREGYYIARGPGGVNPEKPSKQLKFDLLSAADSKMVYDAVPITVVPLAEKADTYAVHIDAKGLVWTIATDARPRQAKFVVMAISFDKKGKELKNVAQLMTVSAPKTVPPTGRIELAANVPLKVEHDAKAVRLRFVVRVNQTGREGTADVNLQP